jgi:hypothetical protein
MPTMSTPAANGSKVPPWPILKTWSSPLLGLAGWLRKSGAKVSEFANVACSFCSTSADETWAGFSTAGKQSANSLNYIGIVSYQSLLLALCHVPFLSGDSEYNPCLEVCDFEFCEQLEQNFRGLG